MKKLISILTVLAMLFTFAAIPSFAEGEDITVDFSSAANLAKGKAVTTIVADGETAEAITEVTDGDAATPYTSEGAVSFYVDFTANYQVNDITLSFGSESASVNVYAGNAVDEANLIGTATNAAPTVNADGKIAQYITIESAAAVTINEIYVDTQLLDGDWNIAKGKRTYGQYSTSVYGPGNTYYSAFNPHTNPSVLTNASVADTLKGGSTSSSAANKNTGYNLVWYIDLGDYYMIDEVAIYGVDGTAGNGATLYLGQTSEINAWDTIGSDTRKFKATIPSATNKVNVTTSSNLAGTAVWANSVDLSAEGEIARYITVVYSAYTSKCCEISVKGTLVEGTIVDFRAESNIAAGKADARSYSKPANARWDFYSSNAPGEGKKYVTDGKVQTYYSGHKDYAMRVDLGAVYDVTSIELYNLKGNSNNNTLNVYLDMTGTYSLASLSADRRKVATYGDFMTINGVDEVRKASLAFDSVPARYIYCEFIGGGDFSQAEIVVNGTKTVKFGEAGNSYIYDSEAGTVTSVLRLYNGTEAASTAGKVYFAAYNADGTLVGYTVADATALDAAESTEIAPAAFSVTEEPTTVKAFYWVDGTFVPVLLPTAIK